MRGKRNKSLKRIVCAGIVTLALAGCAKANLVNPNSVVLDGIEYYIQTDKAVYDLGEDVELLYRITNLRDEEWRVRGLFPIWDILVTENEGEDFREVWSLHWYGGGPAGPVGIRLQPNESKEFSYIWLQIDHKGTWETQDDTQVLPGTYRISGVFDGIEGFSDPILIDTNVGVDIAIIPGPAMIYYVDADASGANNGSSWTDAYNYLQDALADANSGDEIWVAQGVYTPDGGSGDAPGDREATFQLINGIAIKGGYAGFGEPDPNARDIELYETILSGDLDGNDVEVNDPCDLWNEPTRAENSYHVVTGSGTDETAVLDGFIITAGNAYERPWHPMVPDPNNNGGGMYNDFGSPTLNKCTFTSNSAESSGSGMYNKNDSSPMLTNCTFSGNSARSKDGWAGSGGGMLNWNNSSPTLTNCTFTGNRTYGGGGGMYNSGSSPVLNKCTFSSNSAGGGGGMSNLRSNPTLSGCMFISNSADSIGGGMDNRYESGPTVTNCRFSDNSARDEGGGVFSSCSSPMLTNCVFIRNSAEEGGGMYNNMSSTTLTNCVFLGNSGRTGGAISCYEKNAIMMLNCTAAGNLATNGNALACDSSYHRLWPNEVEITNCILWDGGDEIWNSDGSTIEISFSDVQGGETGVYDPCDGLVWGEGNIDANPLFADPNNGDYHLLEDSPCIDAGDPNYPYDPNETDLDGKPRVIGGRIDMGAFEYSPPVPAEVRIVPRTINLQSKGKWIACYIWFGEDYDVADIDPDSVFLEDGIRPVSFWVDEQEQVAIKFSRSEVQSILAPGEVELTVSGELTDGTVFEGTDVIRVIDKGGKK